MTQEFIAQLMGVRREAVTVAAHRLRDLGVIRYTRALKAEISGEKLEMLDEEFQYGG
jgi:CRP-like cAMP-binding protein